MKLPRALATLVVVVLGLGACSGGDKAAPTGEGQPDYYDRVVRIICDRGAASLDQIGDPQSAAALLATQADTLSDLDAPTELAGPQKRLIEAMHNASGVLGKQPADATVDPSSSGAATLNDLASRNTEWIDTFRQHYGVFFFRNSGASMRPTLEDNEVIAPRVLNAPPRRWQIAVFTFPFDPSRDFVKRVVALPGESIEIRADDAVYVNGTKLTDDAYHLDEIANYNYGPKTVPPDQYFVLGDNRANSYDSHAWGSACLPTQSCDFVPKANILGVLDADAKGCAAGRS